MHFSKVNASHVFFFFSIGLLSLIMKQVARRLIIFQFNLLHSARLCAAHCFSCRRKNAAFFVGSLKLFIGTSHNIHILKLTLYLFTVVSDL